jgi:hypothetical protein
MAVLKVICENPSEYTVEFEDESGIPVALIYWFDGEYLVEFKEDFSADELEELVKYMRNLVDNPE